MNGRLVLGSRREVGTVGLVAGMCGFYASVLTTAANLVTVDAESAGSHNAMGVVLSAVATVFVAVALYVAAVVIANGVDTVVAGRLRQIAVLRLLGADARSLRGAVVRVATSVALLGAVVGVLAGAVVGDVVRSVLVARGSLHEGEYAWLPPLSVAAGLAITLVAAVAAWVGSRVVLEATPAQALLGASVRPPQTRRVGRLRRLATFGLIGVGGLLLLAAAGLGESGGAAGFLVAALGAMVSGTGILVGARLVVPALVALASRLLGERPGERGGGSERHPGARAHHPLDDGAGDRGDPGDDLRGGVRRAPHRGALVGPDAAPGGSDRPDAALQLGGHDLHRDGLLGDRRGRLREHDVARGHPAHP